jgi:hypothetical protein
MGWRPAALCAGAIAVLVVHGVALQQEAPPRFGGAYAGLDARRQQLVHNWVARFVSATGQKVEAGPFYDQIVTLSTKTTFDAVTHALMTTRLSDSSGADLGDALALVWEVDSVSGEIAGAPGDRQFRMYVRLVQDAVDRLKRSREFKRGVDNTIYHKGYPINYRGQGGVPSIQISIALDARRADVDVDYRSSSFPAGLFNGHLTSSNSDVRAGNNYERHLNRWTGFQNWWRSFFGVRLSRDPDSDAEKSPLSLPRVPRAGKKAIAPMVDDFLNAWLIEGDIVAAMGYVSERSYACLAQDADNPSDFDRGVAPFRLMTRMKTARDSLGPRPSLDGVLVGVPLADPALKAVRHPKQTQYEIYSMPDDIAAEFDCESRLVVGAPKTVGRSYGTYSAVTFNVEGRHDYPVTLLWARENGYWKIFSWEVGANVAAAARPELPPEPESARVPADPTFVDAARGFLTSWLIDKNADAAFAYLSPDSYGCYDLTRAADAPASTSITDAGARIRASLESAGQKLGAIRDLESVLSSAEPAHPAIRVMNHQYETVFTLTSVPDAIADVFECAARARGATLPDPLPLDYGRGFGMTTRFRTKSGDAPVLRVLWRKEGGTWRIRAYDIDVP